MSELDELRRLRVRDIVLPFSWVWQQREPFEFRLWRWLFSAAAAVSMVIGLKMGFWLADLLWKKEARG